MGFSPKDFPNAERYYARCLSLPMYSGLSDKDQKHVITVLERLLA
jgi:dTDP-4-amino-4,6-dideoxygalactose transaminase